LNIIISFFIDILPIGIVLRFLKVVVCGIYIYFNICLIMYYMYLFLVSKTTTNALTINNTGSPQGNYDYWLCMLCKTFNNISVMSWRPCLFLQKTGVLYNLFLSVMLDNISCSFPCFLTNQKVNNGDRVCALN